MVEMKDHKMKHIMSRILDVRYTDLQEELKLCEQLLEWSLAHADAYGRVFALTYLGDYCLAIYDEENAGKYLLEAQSLLVEEPGWDSLRLRAYSLLGIYYDMRADEQNAVEYYLKALPIAERIKDTASEAVVLNNLGFTFQHCHCYKEAMDYYHKAYDLQSKDEECPFRSTLLGNLAEVALIQKQYEQAKGYIEECERTERDEQQRDIQRYKNWCGYYLSLQDQEEACKYADLLLSSRALVDEDQLTAFEHYYTICQKFMDLNNHAYAQKFLSAMEAVGQGGGLDRMKMLEDTYIRYAILFAPPQDLPQAYRRFYEMNQQFQSKVNKTMADAMKSKIYLDQLMDQAVVMESQQHNLEMEVNRDELTKIYNRKFLENMLRTGMDAPEQLGIIILDVDYFKEYNDHYGHIKGDIVLQEIANCLKSNSSNAIYPCRYGGDEFVCVCKDQTEAEIENYIHAVRSGLEKKNLAHEKSPCSSKVTLSVGYALEPKCADAELHYLFQLADQALYESKASGRNTYTKYKAKTS